MNTNTGQNTTDRHLVERVLSGDTRAFEVIVQNTEKLVAKIVFEMIPVDGDRKDIGQDIYLKTFQKLPTFKFQSKLSTWIGQITYNTCLDFLRKKKLVLSGLINNNNESGDEYDMFDSLAESKGMWAQTTDVVVINKNVSEIVKTGIEKLPSIYKTLITLYHQEELSYDEIGTITDKKSLLPRIFSSGSSFINHFKKSLRQRFQANVFLAGNFGNGRINALMKMEIFLVNSIHMVIRSGLWDFEA